MAGEKPDVLLVGNRKPVIVSGLEPKVTLHYPEAPSGLRAA